MIALTTPSIGSGVSNLFPFTGTETSPPLITKGSVAFSFKSLPLYGDGNCEVFGLGT